jgi:hypothetical protein
MLFNFICMLIYGKLGSKVQARPYLFLLFIEMANFRVFCRFVIGRVERRVPRHGLT